MGIGIGTQEDVDIEALFSLESPYKLILWNDDVNSFGVIIIALEDFLQINQEKAMALAIEAHNNGKVAVADGSREKMEELAAKFGAVAINVTVEAPE